ncbi:MAG: peptide-methionine (S)-S-oxide reductase MsrA [Alphaproteobacteria bacterium]|nr:peptide-methionine (S)-S-oxide reductase MsrA [Alphaproteobacteria bacterium SS10]
MAELERAILAGGCFWGMQDLIRKVPGVRDTRVGYSGGELENPTYNDIKKGDTNHAEAIEITFDPSALSYRRLLEFFYQIHDPTTVDRQGNDRGTQYRSAIFYLTDEQKQAAEEVTEAVNASGRWPGRVVTEITAAKPFWEAEDFHQDYLVKQPNGYTCHWVRPDWVLTGESLAS